jgi:hypothetical protein
METPARGESRSVTGPSRTLAADRPGVRRNAQPSTKAICAELVDADMSRKFKLLLALVLVVLAYRMFVGGDTEVVEYETSD